ncbi:MAG: hypothetical protein ACR2IT_10100, partial [Pirellulales bacterium]
MNIPVPKTAISFRRLNTRSLRLVAVHAAIFATGFFLAFFTRNDFSIDDSWLKVYGTTVAGVVLVKLV